VDVSGAAPGASGGGRGSSLSGSHATHPGAGLWKDRFGASSGIGLPPGEAQKAEIVLAYIIEVPFTLSLDTPVPAEESRGQEALRTAQFIVEQHGLSARTKIIPHRYAWGGILHLTKEEMADAIVMSVGAGRPGLAEGMGRTAQEVIKRAECEVILDKVPL